MDTNPDDPADRELRQRLIICFDGTWNNKDSSTNVFHAHNLVREGKVALPRRKSTGGKEPEETHVYQRCYYDEGVGTGVLDGVSGGAFGLGLEANVRQAYNWLIEHYRDDRGLRKLDEVYIFGFSRGAYTARSLVGLIMRCGLLVPAAPITVNQLWKAYTDIGEYTAGRRRRIERRPIHELQADPWWPRPVDPDPPASREEALFSSCTRRIPITFLGIYDTVGAMGWDALAIPGVRSRLGVMHNMRLSTIVRKCYHAMAIDEHRSSFALTPLLQYEGYGENWNEVSASRNRKKWARKVKQRWFVGAHSNIGGGYADNRLATHPLAWILEGAQKRGLKLNSEIPAPSTDAHSSEIRDSYAEFSKGFWAHVIRAKRSYRRLDPPLDVRGTPKVWRERREREDADQETVDNEESETPPEPLGRQDLPEPKQPREVSEEHAGYALRFVNSALDDSVLAFAKADNSYAPPNLVSYAERVISGHGPKHHQPPADADETRTAILREIAQRTSVHHWLPKWTGRGWFVVWCLLTACGFAALPWIFSAGFSLNWVALCVIGTLLPALDWGESRSTFSLARHPEDLPGTAGPRRRALYDTLMSLRAIALVFFAIGLGAFTVRMSVLGLGADSYLKALTTAWNEVKSWWPVVLGVAVPTVGLAMISDLKAPPSSRAKRMIAGFFAATLAPLALAASGILITIGSYWVASAVGAHSEPPQAPETTNMAGVLITLYIAAAAIAQGFVFVSKPMSTANLGSIVPLQLKAFSPRLIRAQLDTWHRKLTPKGDSRAEDRTPAERLQHYLTANLWRDIFGFIPLYTAALGFGMWIGATVLEWEFLADRHFGLPTWVWLAGGTAVMDLIENSVHLHFARNYSEAGKPPLPLALCGGAATILKFTGFLLSAGFFTVALVQMIAKVFTFPDALGWRGLLAEAIPVAGTLGILVFVFVKVRANISRNS